MSTGSIPDASPVLSVALSANRPVRDITEYADKVLRRQLESVGGVGQVTLLGGRQRQINVWLDADRLRGHNLTVTDVARALQAQNIEIPGGRIDQGPQSLTLRTRGRVQSVAEFNDLVISEKSGHQVRMGDVALVEDGEADVDTAANINGKGTVLLNIRRQSGTNTVEVVNAVKERLVGLKANLPAGYDARIVRDQSEFIEASIHNVEEHLVVGSILAAHRRPGVPGELPVDDHRRDRHPDLDHRHVRPDVVRGFTLNMLTMLALTLSVGIVIDDAIVVLENIYRFIEEKHDRPLSRGGRGDGGDRTGGAGHHAVAGRHLRAGRVHGWHRRPFHEELRPDDGVRDHGVAAGQLHAHADALGPVVESAAPGEGSSTRRRIRGSFTRSTCSTPACSNGRWRTAGIVAGVAVLVLLSSAPLFMIANKNFLPLDDQSEFEINVRAPEGTSLESTEVIANRVASAVREGVPEVAYTLVTVSGDAGKTRNLSNIYVRLKPIEDRKREQFAMMVLVRNTILPPLTKNLRTSVQQIADIGGSGAQNADVQFVVNGPDLKKLEQISQQLVERARSIPGVVDLDTSLNVGKPELSVRIDRPKAADLGVQIGDAAEALRLLVGGDQVTTYNEGSEQYEVHLRARAEQSNDGVRHRGTDRPVLEAGRAFRLTTSRASPRGPRRPRSIGSGGSAR